MIAKKNSIKGIKRAIFGCFFGILGLFSAIAPLISSGLAYAEPVTSETTDVTTPTYITPETTTPTDTDTPTDTTPTETTTPIETTQPVMNAEGSSCKDSLGELGWFICPETNKFSAAVDWLYSKINDILVINPVEAQDGKPIYEIWKYFRGVTNIVFIIFLLIVIYSQLTGLGISNYGIKKALPKLIITAIMVNLSFYICALAVDVSNILGQSLRGMFESIQMATLANFEVSEEAIATLSEVYASLAGGTALTIGAAIISFETGAIWLLIPVVLGAVVAVASGLITIAARQAVVALLIMIAPLAFVAYILPNTEQWFKKWKQLFIKMLVFYPMFSMLFGASSLAGFAIIAGATDGFWVILGLAVQIFPLFFSWSLMKMSGTFLGTVNGKLRGLAARPLAANKAWAESRRQLTKQKNLAARNPYTPSLRLAHFLSDRRIAREEETAEYAETVKKRGQFYSARRNYDKNGVPTTEGKEAYEMQARRARYQYGIDRHKNNMNKGLGTLEAVKAHASLSDKVELSKLDMENVNAFDRLKMEAARGAKIDFDNAVGFYHRVEDARNAKMDADAIANNDRRHQFHPGDLWANPDNLERYRNMTQVMEGREIDTNYIVADAAHSLSAQSQIMRGKFTDLFSYTGPTQDIVNILNDLALAHNAHKDYIDPFIGGLRVLNMRGDTDLAREELVKFLEENQVQLGTYASQAFANYLMFDVKDNDPFLRRFGKYINLETARIYNRPDESLEGEALEEAINSRRKKLTVDMKEYVTGEYYEEDENGNQVLRHSKRPAKILLNGTTFSRMERTAIKSMTDGIRYASIDDDDTLNLENFMNNEKALWSASMANIIGDQFSFLSGSEQIKALGQGLTGMDTDKHIFDWGKIFNKYAKDLSDDQKRTYIGSMLRRTAEFLGGHVPTQISKSKTDILDSVENLLVYKQMIDNDEMVCALDKEGNKLYETDEYGNDIYETDQDGNILYDENGQMIRKEKKVSAFNAKRIHADDYNRLCNKYRDAVKRELTVASNYSKNNGPMFSEEALKGFSKTFHKGYQGEAKNKLIQLLDPEGLYNKYYPYGEGKKNNGGNRPNSTPATPAAPTPAAPVTGNGSAPDDSQNMDAAQMREFAREYEQYHDDDDDEDGMPLGYEEDADITREPTYNEHRSGVEDVYSDFVRNGKHSREFVGEFWRLIKGECEQVLGKTMEIDRIEEGLNQYDDVATLYNRVINDIFGGHSV